MSAFQAPACSYRQRYHPRTCFSSRQIRLCSFSEQPIQKDVELLCSIADLGRKSQTAAFAKPSLGPGICLPILHANTSAYRANHMFHGTFLQTIRFKEDIIRIHIEISRVSRDFIHTFCPITQKMSRVGPSQKGSGAPGSFLL